MRSPAAPPVPTLGFPFDRPLAWLLLLLAAHVLVRVLVSPSVKWDEAEQLLWSQQLALGYGMQPPLYTWLQWGVNQILGPSVLALALLRFAVLGLVYGLMYRAARESLGPRGAWWAAASMMLLPALGWDAIRDRTHTILATAMACAVWWLLLRIVRAGRPRDFAWLGLACGVGLLAKYSFALVIGLMLLAALSVAKVRRQLFAPGWWWALLVGFVVVLPHALWLLEHLQDVSTRTLAKLGSDSATSLAHGLGSLVVNLLGTVVLWLLAAGWAFGAAWWRRPATAPEADLTWARALLWRYLALVLLALVGMVLAGASSFRAHWLLPLLCVFPLAAFTASPELQDHPRGRRFTRIVIALALLVLAAASVRPWFDGLRGRTGELNHPAPELAAALRTAGYDGRSPIVVADHMLGGMLRTRFPMTHVRACTSELGDVATCVAAAVDEARAGGSGWLLISRADRGEAGWWGRVGTGVPRLAPRVIELPFRMVRRGTPPARYTFAWQPPEGS